MFMSCIIEHIVEAFQEKSQDNSKVRSEGKMRHWFTMKSSIEVLIDNISMEMTYKIKEGFTI